MILKVVKEIAVLKQLMSYVAKDTIINNTSKYQGEKKRYFFHKLIVLIVILFAIIR